MTAGHEFDITEDDEDDLSHYHEDAQKREVNTPEEGPWSRYHDLLSVHENDLGSTIKQRFAEICHKIWENSKNNDKRKEEFKSTALLFLRIELLWKPLISNLEMYSRISDPTINKDKAAQKNRGKQ